MTIHEFDRGWRRILARYPAEPEADAEATRLAYYATFGGLKVCAWEVLVRDAAASIDEAFPTVAALKYFVNEEHECERCRTGPPRIRAVARPDDQCWANATQAQLVQAIVHDNQRHDGEPALDYIERIALGAGLMKEPIRLRLRRRTGSGMPQAAER